MGTDIGTIHFVGIGGIGMSGIAEVMHQLGYSVQGSDISESYVVEGLRKAGIPVAIGHDADNLGEAAVVVCSTAISRGNPEIEAAKERRLPLVRRAEMLAELMRMQSTIAVAGTHGKTTTTSMIAAMLDAGGLDPTVINGGIINSYGSNARLGKSDWMVVEADESDGSFLRLDGTIAVVTNIDPEHLEHYGSFERAKDAYVEFVENVPFYGLAVMCVDHPEVQNILSRIRDRRVVTYGFSTLADIRADNVVVEGRRQPVRRDRAAAGRREARDRGRASADAGAAQCAECARRDRGRRSSLAWTMRRSSTASTASTGSSAASAGSARSTARSSSTITPTIRSKSARCCRRRAKHAVAAEARVIAVVQPHRYTRLQSLMEDFQNAFNDADVVFVTPVYAAGEEPIEGVDSEALLEGLARPRPPHGARGGEPRRARRGAARPRRRGRHDPVPGRGRHHQMGGGPGGRNSRRAEE